MTAINLESTGSRADYAAESSTPRRHYRIAFIGGRGIGGLYSGIETFYEEVGSRLVARGHEVTVYCRPHFTTARGTYRGLRIRMMPAPRSKHFETLTHSLLSTLHASVVSYDVVHIHAIGSAVFSWLPRLRGTKTVVTVHALDWQRPKWNNVARFCLRAAEWMSVRLPTSTTAVSRAVATHLHDAYGRRVHVVPNGVAANPLVSEEAVRALGLEPGCFVLFVGRLSEEKRCLDLIEAFQRLAPPGLQLVIAGGATYASDYERQLRARAGPTVQFVGWQPQVTLAALYRYCTLFVLPSSLEGMSVALLEAMVNGAPILVSDIAANLEAGGDTVWSFRSCEVDDLERHLRHLLASPDALREGGFRARDRAMTEFSWDAVVRRMEGVYNTLYDNERSR